MTPRMTTEEAILHLRQDPASRDLVRSAYLDEDVEGAAERFRRSEEFLETLRLVGQAPLGRVLDLGAGTGIASLAFADSGAREVVAIEPDPSDVVGLGCLTRVMGDRVIRPVAALGGAVPVTSGTVDVVYCRQVLHHIPELAATLAECARVLRPGGVFLAVREHVVDDDVQLAQFRAAHPVHQLAGGEGAHSLAVYRAAILGAGLHMTAQLGTWDSIVNAFPDVERAADLPRAPSVVLGRRFGAPGRVAGTLPGIRSVVWTRLRRPRPGRLYSFVAVKPEARPVSQFGALQ
jgi:SAM-dependent methyltransferase